MKKFFTHYLINFKNYLHVSLSIGIAVLMLILMIFSSQYLISSYMSSKDTEARVESMKAFLADWQKKVERLDSSELRAVSPNDLDSIQASLIYNLQLNNLKLTAFRSVSPAKSAGAAAVSGEVADKDQQQQKKKKKEAEFRHDYEIEFEGDYDSVMKYISEFKARNALINIQGIEFKSKKDVLSVRMKYRAYTI